MANTSLLWKATILGLVLAAGCGDDGSGAQEGGDGDSNDDQGGASVSSEDGCNTVKVLGKCFVGYKTEEECASSGGTWGKCPTDQFEGTCEDTDSSDADAVIYYYSQDNGDPWDHQGSDAAEDCQHEYMGDFVSK